jgi:uncharacterized protein (TIGR02145 family)
MKTLQSNAWKVITFFVVISFLLTSCKPGDDPSDPDPDDPTPGELVAPKVSLMAAENITKNTATLVGWVTGNEKGATAYFSYKTAADANWAKKPIGAAFNTKDSVKVTLDLSLLQPETEYMFKLTAENKVSSKESVIRTFTTLSNVTATDYNGNSYKVVKIGNQYWLAENFKGTHFADGTAITNVTGDNIWVSTDKPAMCWLNNDSKHKDISGGLYNSYVYTNSKKIINGWHTPTMKEIKQLIDYLGGNSVALPKVLDSSEKNWVWMKEVFGIKATNSSGLTVIPSGSRHESGMFVTSEKFTFVSKDYSTQGFYLCYEISGSAEISEMGAAINSGFNIRLIKD